MPIHCFVFHGFSRVKIKKLRNDLMADDNYPLLRHCPSVLESCRRDRSPTGRARIAPGAALQDAVGAIFWYCRARRSPSRYHKQARLHGNPNRKCCAAIPTFSCPSAHAWFSFSVFLGTFFQEAGFSLLARARHRVSCARCSGLRMHSCRLRFLHPW
jgi:hypothetical protein